MENTLHIQVLREGEPDPDFMPVAPSFIEAAGQAVQAKLVQLTSHVVLQAQMALYDVWHGTNYRQIRNELVREQKQRQFEQKIGLTACH